MRLSAWPPAWRGWRGSASAFDYSDFWLFFHRPKACHSDASCDKQ